MGRLKENLKKHVGRVQGMQGMRLIGIRSVSPAIVLATCSMCLLLAVQLEAQAEVPAMKLEWTWNVSEHPEFAQANLYGVTLGAVVADDIDADGDYEILWAFRKAEDRVTVSYTHLTLPTTPYV